jgi:hypothetical protein
MHSSIASNNRDNESISHCSVENQHHEEQRLPANIPSWGADALKMFSETSLSNVLDGGLSQIEESSQYLSLSNDSDVEISSESESASDNSSDSSDNEEEFSFSA